jgi:aryl-alcohol dehydrogenase-like predicted oxidoreductase
LAAGTTEAEWGVIDELLAIADEVDAPAAAVAIAWVRAAPGSLRP